MMRTVNRFLPIVFAGMFVYGGCAKQEVVRNDEPLIPSGAKQAESASMNRNSTTEPAADKATVSRMSAASPSKGGEQISASRNTAPAAGDKLSTALEKVYFDFDSSTLSKSARDTMDKNFVMTMQHPQSRIRVEGHCDERGSGEYNLALGERRAQAAVRYLVTRGVQKKRLSFISYGKEKPADPGHDESSWANNRRDEFIVSH